MRFRKGGRRKRKWSWRWKGRVLKEMKEFKYLGYVFRANGDQEAQVKDRVKRAAMVLGQGWSIGKRLFSRDVKRRLYLFDILVWTVLGYGSEIWG